MSCQIKTIANLTNTSNIKELLFGDSAAQLDHVQQNELPLQDCFISMSSAGDVLAMACNTKMIILISRWDWQEEEEETKNKFHMIWYEEIAKDQNEWITSVICLPLLSLGKVSGGANPDWTCVVVGFNTGFVKFYTETGALLLSEQLHNEPVIGLKCQSYSSAKHAGDTKMSEEVYIIYSSAVCVLQGFQLFSTLRACRNHLARVQANCDDLPPTTNLAYKKWGYKSQDIVNDTEVIGTTSVNSFDHLMMASICGGYNASYRSSAPQHSLVIATGKRPFIGFHYALEGGAAPVLSDVAIAMASKLANAIGTAVPWFWGSSKHQSSVDSTKTNALDPVEPMTCRFGLSDITREGYSIVTSPNKTLSVIADTMGRVVLVDNIHGIAVRMWKGYRDAQCGWIEVEEEKHSGTHKASGKRRQYANLRTAVFLVIYAPKKGIIDIWGVQQGPKITTFTASKNGRLLYMNYGLLGISENSMFPKNKPQYACVFMDPLGGLKEITVPFHFALNSKNGKRARDIHLLKKLKTFLREGEYDNEKLIAEIRSACLDLETNEIRVQMIEMLMTNKNIIPDALLLATNCFIEKLGKYEEGEMEPAAKSLHLLTMQLRHVINFYKFVRMQFNAPPDYEIITANDDLSVKDLSSILITSEREIHRTIKLFTMIKDFSLKNHNKEDCKVKFKEDRSIFTDFLSCFEFGTQGVLTTRKDINAEKKYQISRLIYQGWMHLNGVTEMWKEAAKNSNIKPFVLMEFALIYWLNKVKTVSLGMELKQFTQLLNVICLIDNIEEICVGYNEISSWWKSVRNILSESTNPFNALTAALVCRAVAITLERCKERIGDTNVEHSNFKENEGEKNEEMVKIDNNKESNSKSEDDSYNLTAGWENLSKDSCQFTLLIGSLADITILNAIVSQQPVLDDTTQFFALPFAKCDVSLSLILTKGKGSVSEIVARWLSSTGIDPAEIVDIKDIEFEQTQVSLNPEKSVDSLEEACNVDVSSQDQEKLLSLSVELGSEAKTDTSAKTDILEKMTLLKCHFPYSLSSSVLLANLCWEFAMSWNKDITQLQILDAALSVLRQIPMKYMRHGVCCLLWSLYIKKRLETTTKLMNKLGKLPKERLCMQEIGLSDIQLTTFLQHCVAFLEIFIDCEVLEPMKTPVIKSEELWEGCTGGPQPFATLAISQASASYDLILLHLQLANVLHMIAQFNIKIQRLLTNLFDSVVQPYFFQSMSEKVMLTWYRDDKRDNARTNFLCRVLTASMDYFILQESADRRILNSAQAIHWLSRCEILASMWKINSDELRIHQVCRLYVSGFDRLAEEILTAVNDTERLAHNLLEIAGRRMIAYLSATPDLPQELSQIIPALTKYLQSLQTSDIIYTNCSNDDTIELIRQVARFLPETHSDYHLAQLMLDATSIYEDGS